MNLLAKLLDRLTAVPRNFWTKKRTSPQRPPLRRTRLSIDVLEDRMLLSGLTPGYSLIGGNLYNTSGAQPQLIDSHVALFAVSPDGTVFDVRGNGRLLYTRPGGALTAMDAGVKSIAVGADGTLYDLETSGLLYSHTWAGGWSSPLDSSAQSPVQQFVLSSDGSIFDLHNGGSLHCSRNGGAFAGMDAGVKSIAVGPDGTLYDLETNGVRYSYTWAGGWHQIGPSDATQVVTTGNGNLAVLQGGTGVVFEHVPGSAATDDQILATGGTRRLAVEGNGELALLQDNLQGSTGYVYEYTQGTGWANATSIGGTGITQMVVEGNGDLVMLRGSTGEVFEHTPGGNPYNDVRIANGNGNRLAVEGNGDLAMLRLSTGQVFEHTPGANPSSDVSIPVSGITQMAVEGNGQLALLQGSTGQVIEYTAGTGGRAIAGVTGSITQMAVEGNGELALLEGSTGLVYEHTPGTGAATTATGTGGGITQMAVEGNGQLALLRGGTGQVLEYTPGSGGGAATVTGGGITQMTVEGDGDLALLLGNGGGVVELHTPGTGGGPNALVGNGAIGQIAQIAAEGNGDLVLLQGGTGRVFEYTPGTGGTATATVANSGITQVAVEGNGQLVMLRGSIGQVFEYTPGTGGAVTATVANSGITQMAVEGNGEVALLRASTGEVFEHVPGGNVEVNDTHIAFSGIWQIAAEGNGDLALLAYNTGAVYEHTPGTGGADVPTIANIAITQMAVEGDGQLALLRGDTGQLLEYTPGTGGTVKATIANSGITQIAVEGNGDLDMLQRGTGNVFEHLPGSGAAYGTRIGGGAIGFSIDTNGYVLMYFSSGKRFEYQPRETVIYDGGSLLPNVEVQGLYYGNAWVGATQYQQLDGFLSNIVSSAYLDMLANAGYGVGRGTSTAGTIDPVASGTVVNDSTLRRAIQYEINSGSLAPPDANRLYVVYVEPNVEVVGDDINGLGNSVHNFAGYHSVFPGTDARGNSATIHYAVVPTPGGSVGNGFVYGTFPGTPQQIAQDSMTVATSHELAEAVTDPNNGYSALGWYDPRNGEIGDLAVGNNVILNNYYVQDIADKFGNPMTPVGATPATSIRNIATTRSSALQSATNTAPTMAPQNATDRLFMALGVGQLPEALSALRPSAGSELGSDREYFNEAIPARGTARNRTAKAPLAANPSSPMTARPSEARATMAGIDEATNSHTKGTARRVLAIRGAPSGFDQILEDAAHALTYQLATA